MKIKKLSFLTENTPPTFKKELKGIVILLLLLLVFFIPLIFKIEGICFDDAALVSFPKLVNIARAFQNGEVPLWDRHTFMGGKPFYLTLESPIYNVLYYPFFLIANTEDINQSFFVLYIIPFILLIILSSIGTYLFSRLYFKFNILVSIVAGFLWAVNPSLGMSTYSTVNTTVFSLLPWLILAIVMFFETKKLVWWIIGLFSIFLINSAYTLNYSFRIYFLIAIIFIFLSIWYFLRDKKNLFTSIIIIFMFISGFLCSSHVWSGILEGLSITSKQIKMSYFDIVSVINNNMPPLHLITLFIPNFNGSLDSSHAWGDGLLIFSPDRILTGGIFTCFIIFILVNIVFKHKNFLNEKIHFWSVLFLSINIITILVMLGKFTPVYYILCKILPWFFVIPYPYYYHFAHHFSSIVLIIIAINITLERETEIKKIKNSFVFYYILFIILFILIYLFSPVPSLKMRAYYYLTKFNEWAWFIKTPIFYFVIFSMLLIGSFIHRGKRYEFFKYSIILGILFEAIYIGYNTFYKNTTIPRVQNLNLWEKMQRTRYSLPKDNPLFSSIDKLKTISFSEKRWCSDVTTVDCLAWITKGQALGGYDSKPLLPEIEDVLKSFYTRFPYELIAYAFPKYLLNNLNVGYLFAYDNLKENNEIYQYEIDNIKYYLIRNPNTYKNFGDYFKNFKGPHFKIYILEEPIGELFFQNRIFKTDKKTQKEILMKDDLRKFALLDDKVDNIQDVQMEINIFDFKFLNDENYIKNFEELQKKNKIKKISEKNNSLIIDVEIENDTLLIRNMAFHRGWKVFIDNKLSKIYKVNYLQQGIFIPKGKHRIKFLFLPNNIKISFFVSIFSAFFILLGIIFVIILQNHFLSRKKTHN